MKSKRDRAAKLAIVALALSATLICLSLLGRGANAKAEESKLEIEYVNPVTSMGFTNVVVTKHGGVKTIHVSGQVGRGETMLEQATVAFEALKTQLAAAGATPDDVIKLNTYIKDFTGADLAGYREAKGKVFTGENQPASTLVGVQALVFPDFRIEIEAIAMVEE